MHDLPPDRPAVGSALLARFCAERRWSLQVAREVGLVPVTDRRGWPRIRFPFRRRGEVVYWQDRAVYVAVEPRWLSARGPTPCPFEIDRIRNVQDGWLVIVEGLSDVIAILHPFPNAAVIGLAGALSMKDEWARFFRGLRICIIADNDSGGEKMRELTTQRLQNEAEEIAHAYVPVQFSDIDAWRQTDTVTFPQALLRTLEDYDGGSL